MTEWIRLPLVTGGFGFFFSSFAGLSFTFTTGFPFTPIASSFKSFLDTLSRWDYIVGYLPDVWKFGLFPIFNAAKIVLISYLDNIFGLQSHTKSPQSKKSIFTLMGSHIDNSENSIIMSFKDKKIIYEAFWMFKTLYLMVPWSFVTLEPEKIDQILIFQFVPWLCLCDVKYLPLKVFGHWGH